MSRNPNALRATRSLACIILACGMVACGDTRNESSSGHESGVATSPVRATPLALQGNAFQKLQQRTQAAWVGGAHNKAIDDFRERLRKPGVLTRNACSFIEAFVSDARRFPADHRPTTTDGMRRVARNQREQVELCRKQARAHSVVFSPEPASPGIPQSTAASEALAAMEQAIDEASTPEELATRLVPIVEASISLSPIEQAAIGVSADVAVSSYQYWRSGLPELLEEVEEEYYACASGYSGPDDSFEGCLGGTDAGGSYEVNDAIRFDRTRLVFATAKAGGCETDPSEGFRKMAKADLRGAFAGAFSGAFFGGWAGAFGGGLVGGAGASIWAGVELVWDQWWCIMRQR